MQPGLRTPLSGSLSDPERYENEDPPYPNEYCVRKVRNDSVSASACDHFRPTSKSAVRNSLFSFPLAMSTRA
jgi:hypothetical protein